MSKKILIDESLFELILSALENESVYRSASKAFREAKGKHYSVLEWHPMSEAPSNNAERVFVEYSDGGFGFVFGHPEIIKDDPDYNRWAYLPE